MREDLIGMLAANVRNPRDFRGDLAAMIGAPGSASGGCGPCRRNSGRIRCAQRSRPCWTPLSAMPGHRRRLAGRHLDGRGVARRRRPRGATSRSAPAVTARQRRDRGPHRVRPAGHRLRQLVARQHAQSAVAMAFAYLLDPDCAATTAPSGRCGWWRRPGTVVWAHEGAPVTLCTSQCSNEIVEAVIAALAPACPDRAMGGWGGASAWRMPGRDPRTGRRFIWHMFQARPGGGASSAGDGWPAGGRVAFGRRHQVRQRRGGRGALSAVLRARTNSATGSGGAGRIAAGDGAS